MADKLNRIEVEEKLKSLGIEVFTPMEFAGVFEVPLKTATNFISTNLNSGLFIKLRNSHYQLKDSNPSLYFIANKLYQPSYISLESALSHYHIIPEVIYGISSVTTKATQEFATPRGDFSYQRIKQTAFMGYSLKEIDDKKALFADAEKALADYLYFVELKKVSLNDRLELKSIQKNKLIEYAQLFKRPGLIKLIDHVYAESRKPRKIY